MPRTSHQLTLRHRVSAVAAVSAALLLPAIPSHAAVPDDAPAGSMIITVVVPERSSRAGDTTPDGSSSSRGAGTDPLAVTGLDATALWVAALAAGGAIVLGGGAVAVSRRRRQ